MIPETPFSPGIWVFKFVPVVLVFEIKITKGSRESLNIQHACAKAYHLTNDSFQYFWYVKTAGVYEKSPATGQASATKQLTRTKSKKKT